jgi:Phage capsid family
MIGRRFVESEPYLAARKAGAFTGGGPLPAELLDGVELLSEAELRAELQLRTTSDLTIFDIGAVPALGELPEVGSIPGLVETIPVTKLQVPVAVESSEIQVAAAAADGQPLPEGSINFAGLTYVKLPRVGAAEPIAKSVLDEPGVVASILDRRLTLGFTLGLENEILTGASGLWTGVANLPTSATGDSTHAIAVAKGAMYRVEAIGTAVAKVQDNGWYVRKLQVISSPDTRLATYIERDTAARPLAVSEVLDDQVDGWYVSKFLPAGVALVGDFFHAVALFQKGGLETAVSTEHADFVTRGLVELLLVTRAYAWIRQAGAIAIVTGL